MSQITGQLDIFAELGESSPVPSFTVYTCVWAEKGCGWCGSGSMLGGGACRNPQNKDESFFYSYCTSCYSKYRSPKVTDPDFPVRIDRTQKARPGSAPDFSKAVAE